MSLVNAGLQTTSTAPLITPQTNGCSANIYIPAVCPKRKELTLQDFCKATLLLILSYGAVRVNVTKASTLQLHCK